MDMSKRERDSLAPLMIGVMYRRLMSSRTANLPHPDEKILNASKDARAVWTISEMRTK